MTKIRSRFAPFVSLLVVGGLAVGCGDDEGEDGGGSTEEGTVNEAVVQQTVSTTHGAALTASGGDGQAAAFAMLGAGTASLGLIAPSGGQSSGQSLGDWGTAQQAIGDGTCECTENSCTFDDCGNGTGLGISGTISWTETSLDCDYTVAGSQTGQELSFSVFCDLDFSDTSIDGQLNTAGSIAVQGTSTEFDTQLTYNQVTISGGTPTGGSIDVSASVTTNGQTYGADQTIEF